MIKKLLTGLIFGLVVMLMGCETSEAVNIENVKLEKAVFAGGCFWCMEPPFEKLDGVKAVISGYTGGHKDNPTYKEVSSGGTGHTEAIEIHYDPNVISYEELLDVFLMQIDPTDANGQFVDRGDQYRPAIFYKSGEEKALAIKAINKLTKSGKFAKPIAVEITPSSKFYAAEEYHQDFYKKSPAHYKQYRKHSGRDQFIEKVWAGSTKNKALHKKYKKPPEKVIKEKLNPLQYKVTQKNGTEPAFNNEYWNNKKAGIYVDVVSGEPLFSSTDKFASGTGWPSFVRPLVAENVVEKKDGSLGMMRIEVRSKNGDSHLGHVFNDGPAPTNLRYCINSSSLRFIPVEDMEKEGYGEYLKLFKQ